MQRIELKIEREGVFEEVEKATAFRGAKLTGGEDDGAYDRLMASGEELETLGRFWEESCVAADDRLKEMRTGGSHMPDYEVKLDVADRFDAGLTADAESSLKSFMILSVTSKWYSLSDQEEAGAYAEAAGNKLKETLRLLLSRKRGRL